MTIETCIGLVDAMEPNGYSEEVKRRILEELEGRVRVDFLVYFVYSGLFLLISYG